MTDEEIEKVFEDARQSRFSRPFWDMLLYIGDEDEPRVEWEPQVRELLNHEHADIAGEAIKMLASKWQLVNFKDECVSFAGHPEEEIRQHAVAGLATLGLVCGDYDLALFLREVLDDEGRSLPERYSAAFGIPRILEGGFERDLIAAIVELQKSGMASSQIFNELVPWEALDEMLTRHKP